jgi:hypothetical protein
VCDLETSRMGAPYIYDISHPKFNTNKNGVKWQNLKGINFPFCCLKLNRSCDLHHNHAKKVQSTGSF